MLTSLKQHLTLGTGLALLLTLVSVAVATGLIGPGTTLYHVLGYVSAVLTVLGVKVLSAGTASPSA